tara:strand:+ start:27253 stop:28143 length:891 start_codon:yes stop_codon:yes gene_type:complete
MEEITRQELINSEGPFPEEEIYEIDSVSGGSIHESWHIKLKNDEEFFIKTTSLDNFSMLQYEATCLTSLRKYSNKKYLFVPKPIALRKLTNCSILVIPWLNFAGNNQKNLGIGLAHLHKNSSDNNPGKFGWSNDGFIGSGLQKGGWGSDWGKFFVTLRLIPQIQIAAKWGLVLSDYENLLQKIIFLLDKHEPKPSLVHGDLWGGNAGVNKNRQGIIFDPASWWADREVDIAMTKLFGGFSPEFYIGYESIWKLKSDSKDRETIYNLYHVINHANIFAGSYIEQSLSLLNQLNLRIK